MNTNATLSASPRDGTGKGVARKLRAGGQVPAVVYGKDAEAVLLAVDAREAEQLFQGISVGSTIVDLKIEGEKKPVSTLVREVQVHPYKPALIHIDFMRIQMDVAVEVEVPLHVEGQAEGVRVDGGTMEQVVHLIPIRCLPSRIPEALTLDVTELQIGDSLHVSDLEADDDVQILMDGEQTLISISAPRVEEVEEEEVEEGLEGELAEAGEAEGDDAAPEAEAEEG